MSILVKASIVNLSSVFEGAQRNNALHVAQINEGIHSDLAQIGTSEVNLGKGTLTDLGWAWFKNHGSGLITLGAYDNSVFYETLHLAPGQPALCRLFPSVTVRAVANTPSILEWTFAEA